MQAFLRGVTNYGRGLGVIAKHGLWLYFWIPALLSLVLGYGILRTAWNVSDDMGHWLISFYPFEWGSNAVEQIASVAGGLFLVVFTLLIFRYVIMAVASPFMSLLSDRMEQKMYPDRPRAPFSISQMLKDLVRGIRIALRNIIRELLLTLLLFLLGVIIPLIAPIVPFLILLVQAYYAGFGNFDYTLERRMGVYSSVRYVRARRWKVIGNGIVFVLLLMTIIGFVFALPLGTAAGAVTILEEETMM